MPTVTLAHRDDFDGWRIAARSLVANGTPPSAVTWTVAGEGGDLLGGDAAPVAGNPSFTVPKAFIDMARRVVCNVEPERFALLHAALAQLRTRPKLLDDQADPLVQRLYRLDKGVRRDVHKMRAFVRFREVEDEAGERFAAWFEPEHHIVRLNSGFFVRRFAQMRWSILTPLLCVHWDTAELSFTSGALRGDAPEGDPIEAVWKTYYSHIFNPARLKVNAMTKEMPKKYWKNLPEAALIPDLIAGAGERVQAMIDTVPRDVSEGRHPRERGDPESPGLDLTGAIPATESATLGPRLRGDDEIDALRTEAAACTRCPLYGPATQTVFGEGPPTARLMFVGEQPGDQEDLAGKPFIGPAGQVFDRALAAAGIDRTRAYVTNAVKHFKFEARGKRRIHSKPGTGEIEACKWWIDQERAAIKPAVTVALGATAARSLTGKTVTISRERGRAITLADGSELWITVHPSFLLRIEDRAAADLEYDRFVADLTAIRERVAALG
ncbi:UdgX family uracil-DNA binding protein [Glacieibacterium frigidum]|uniref:Type-4 uracil-DNA glycosylase n=1 Tax=Glacieibacterium frigidum TaxID=2593303 RepID=A0A552U7T1_9SPHN|nr:UdgX family uracil-DNA binding protein [Glacieibacterium frigidum]TRW14277.1 UdgX family uracil-DNA binding protein [Glacieibacterium frigidum]